MSHLYYRLTDTTDPEERLEDAALYKALHDVYGRGLTLVPQDADAPKDGLLLGRGRVSEFHTDNLLSPPNLPYWKDPAFTEHISRSFIITDLEGAEKEVKRLHADGKDAFLKSTRQKHFVGRINTDQSFYEEMDGIIYSFIDRKDCLMVQEAVDMQYEHRFLVMNGKVVTHSPVAWHLTPMSREWIRSETQMNVGDIHYQNPKTHQARYSPKATQRMLQKAQLIADASDTKNLCIDLAILGDDLENGQIELIEFNPMQPGGVGLYACDPARIADAVWAAMDPELQEKVSMRRDGLLPAGFPAMEKKGEVKRHPALKHLIDDDEPEGEDFTSIEDEEFQDFDEQDQNPRPQICPELIRFSRDLGHIAPMLLIDDLLKDHGEEIARRGAQDLNSMIDHAFEDYKYHARLMDWMKGKTSTVALREIFTEAMNSSATYWSDSGVADRIDTLDSASLHIEGHAEAILEMEDIRQLAISLGARFTDISLDEDLSKSYSWCESRTYNMSPSEKVRYAQAVAEKSEDYPSP